MASDAQDPKARARAGEAAAEASGEVAAGDAARPFVLALDVGTSSVRACVFDARAREVVGTAARAARQFETTPEGGDERDADELVEMLARAVDDALARAPAEVSARVEAVAVACFWHGLVGVAAARRPAPPRYGWGGTPPAAEAESLARATDERAAHARTGCRFHPSYWPAKLLWLRKHRAELCRASARWLSFGEYLLARLCGDKAARASVSMASGTGIFDVRACRWDAPLLAALSVDERRLPPLADDGATFRLADEYAARWPRLRDATFFPAVGDGAANNVGEGCVSRSRVALMVGTSAAVRVVYEGLPPEESDAALWCYRVDRRRVITGGALSDGGGLYAWLARSLALEHRDAPMQASPAATDEPSLDEALAATRPDAHGLTVLPFWSGERSTGWHARARGAVVGMGLHTRPEEIVRASVEAVAYRLASVARALDAYAPGAEVRASGGALRSSTSWAQVLADVLNRPLVLSGVREASSRGAVLLALEAMGALQSVSDVAAPRGLTLTPDAARHAVYRRAAERHERLYELLVGDPRVAELFDSGNTIAKG